MASDQRIRDERRVRAATRSLLVGSLAATAAFGGFAAANRHGSTATPGQPPQTDLAATAHSDDGEHGEHDEHDEHEDDDFESAAPATAPRQSVAPPVVQSGGS